MKHVFCRLFAIKAVIIISILPLACLGQELDAHIAGSSDKQVFLTGMDASGRTVLLDSTLSRNDSFSFTRKAKEPGFYTITLSQVRGALAFIWDGDIQLEGSIDSLWQTQIEGSPLTDEFHKYEAEFTAIAREKLIAISQQKRVPGLTPEKLEELDRQQEAITIEARKNAENYVLKNPDSFVALFLLSSIWTGLGDERAKQLISSLNPQLQAHSYARGMLEQIKLNETVSAGRPAPDFKALDMNGREISLSKLRGQYVLLDFWGTWCGPCIKLIPETKEAYKKYKGKGVQFVGVAYDKETDREKLRGMIERQGLEWPQVFQDMSDERKRPVVDKFVVNSYPSIILINPKGDIIYRGTGEPGLTEATKVLDKELLSR